MKDLIEALTIFAQYCTAEHNPTHCEHDVLFIMGVDAEDPTDEEITRLDALGFFWSDENDAFISYRYGSA
jgi:hypothetical protein